MPKRRIPPVEYPPGIPPKVKGWEPKPPPKHRPPRPPKEASPPKPAPDPDRMKRPLEPGEHAVSRGALKLQHALSEFGVSVEGQVCADFGCSSGGFTETMLRHGAASVLAVDTGYGVLDWRVRINPRVRVMERTNALHLEPKEMGPFDLITVDMSWTPQRLCIPAAVVWLKPGGRVVTLIKPHYEASQEEKRAHLRAGVLDDGVAEVIARRVFDQMPGWGVRCLGLTGSPIRGGGSATGNLEWLALVERPA